MRRALSQAWFGRKVRLALCVLAATVCCQARSWAAEPWPLWESYANKYLDAQGRVIDHGAEDRSTTEGEAYAMFFALVANDRARFDKLVEWTEVNMAQGDLTLHLPAWNWGKASDGSWKILDPNPAADADLWMAYSLCEAGRLWHDERYSKLGGIIADRVAEQEITKVPGVGVVLLPGAKGFHPDDKTWFLNPSYMPPMLLSYFAHRKPKSEWGDIAQSLPVVVASKGGYVMDWLKAEPASLTPSLHPAAAQESKPNTTAGGSYEAIRVYLWMGIADQGTPGVRESLAKMSGMASYLQLHTTPPLKVDATGKVLDTDAPSGFSASVIPYSTLR